jgi:hypothetical protein
MIMLTQNIRCVNYKLEELNLISQSPLLSNVGHVALLDDDQERPELSINEHVWVAEPFGCALQYGVGLVVSAFILIK